MSESEASDSDHSLDGTKPLRGGFASPEIETPVEEPVVEKPKRAPRSLSKEDKKQVKQTVAEKRRRDLKQKLEEKLLAESEAKEQKRKTQASNAGRIASENQKIIKQKALQWDEYVARKNQKKLDRESQPHESEQMILDSPDSIYNFLSNRNR